MTTSRRRDDREREAHTYGADLDFFGHKLLAQQICYNDEFIAAEVHLHKVSLNGRGTRRRTRADRLSLFKVAGSLSFTMSIILPSESEADRWQIWLPTTSQSLGLFQVWDTIQIIHLIEQQRYY